ncbi:MAG: flagellar protein FlbD [Actinomycetota bacterium]|nr:flagellar protein FlbD [Actinomycetota bacterium]
MIILTRLGGREMAVNPDLIERAEPTPDTVLTMIDGHKLIVAETLPEVVELIRQWRASVALRTLSLSRRSQDLDLYGTDLEEATEVAEICEIPGRPITGREGDASSRSQGQVLRLPRRET